MKKVTIRVLFVMGFIAISILYILHLCFGFDPNARAEQRFEWFENVSRNPYDYIQPNKNTVIISPTGLCSSPLMLLVVVCARAERRDMRDAIRSTWGAVPRWLRARVVFLLGESSNDYLQAQIKNESVRYGDIVQEGFVDTYNNLTLKSLMMLKWMTSHCRDAEYVVKTDDDMFINLPALARLVKILRPGDLLMGHVKSLNRVERDERSKWYMPTYMYPWKYYPVFLSGVTYIMSNDVAYRLYEVALNTPLLHLEDVYLTGIVATKAGIRRRHTNSILHDDMYWKDPCIYRNNGMVAYWHRIRADEMRKMWRSVKRAQHSC